MKARLFTAFTLAMIIALLGNLANLQELFLSYDLLSGALPQNLMNLHLTFFWFDNTDLCEPGDVAFQSWLVRTPLPRSRGSPPPARAAVPPDCHPGQAALASPP